MDNIVHHLKGKSEFRAPKGSASQASAAASSAFRRETVHMEPFQDTSIPESTYDLADMSHVDTHTPTPRLRGISMTSSSADSDFQSALVESQGGITELKDIVTKKVTDNKADNPLHGFCDFLKVEVVQLTSDSYNEFQQDTFNLLMRLKWSDKQQRYRHGMGKSTAAYSQASNQYPLSHPDAGPIAADAADIYTGSTRTATAAAFTTFTAVLPTDIYTATCTGATAVPKHAVRVAHTTAAAAAHTTNCPRFRAAAHATRQPINCTTANITQHKFLPAAGHIATSHRH